MNANELADYLEVDSWYKLVTREEIATMLRQQQAEIEALKKELDRAVENYTDKAIEIEAFKANTLTDEEITEVLNDENIAEYHQGNWLVLPYAFARAILKKASEK